MSYTNKDIARVAQELKRDLETATDKRSILKDVRLKGLFDQIKTIDPSERSIFGKELNSLKQELAQIIEESVDTAQALGPIDITAPWADNASLPGFLPASQSSLHPITQEIERISEIFYKMGFVVEDAPEIDDDYHMFTSLNFPDGHPAR
ncbi:phenylalanine--tRNA ligase subunit alpha, partial [Candidatus Saccharibacteria bacterium]|nr:phenylalanine--tRNA ligase subunit alpha [Candidatus Saccharibacteria bacterium]